MDVLVTEQIWALVMFVFGSLILGTCSKWEKEDKKFASDPRNRFGKINTDKAKPKTLRGTLMTTLGTVLCVGGMILFLLHV
jgi:hypothetical protein